MGQYENLVKALRCCAENFGCPIECPRYSPADEGVRACVSRLEKDAASAIEDMAKHITEMHERVTVLQIARGELEAEVRRFEPKRGEWIVREVDSPGEMHPVAFRCMCSMCLNEYVFPRIPKYCPDCGSMNTAKMEVQE